jgi:PAS domain S-box-containing protein
MRLLCQRTSLHMERKARILVVDSDLDRGREIANTLRGEDFDVSCAESATAALEIAQKVIPDVVLLDMLLADLPGNEVCHRMKTNEGLAGVKVIHVGTPLLTSIPGIALGSNREADGYLTRPLAPEVLTGSVRAMVRLKRVEQQLRRADQLWRTVFATTREAILLLGDDLMIVEANPKAAELLGFPIDELIQKNLLQLCTEGVRETVSSRLQECASGRLMRLQAELIRQNASPLAAEMHARHFEIESNAFFEIVIRNLDDELNAEHAAQAMTLELDFLSSYTSNETETVTAAMYAGGPISQLLPAYFEELTIQYQHIIDLALQEKTYRIHHDLSEQLRQLAARLGRLRAASRDVIELHTVVLKRKMADGNPRKQRAYNVEGRFMLVELLGRLATYYRDRAMSSFPSRSRQ